jgi:hypothetical protein
VLAVVQAERIRLQHASGAAAVAEALLPIARTAAEAIAGVYPAGVGGLRNGEKFTLPNGSPLVLVEGRDEDEEGLDDDVELGGSDSEEEGSVGSRERAGSGGGFKKQQQRSRRSKEQGNKDTRGEERTAASTVFRSKIGKPDNAGSALANEKLKAGYRLSFG